jgi:hypothetical protein
MENLVTQAVRFKEKAILEKEKDSTISLVTLLEKVTETTTSAVASQGGQAPSGPVTIKLMLNEREFAKATTDSLNKANRLRMRS